MEEKITVKDVFANIPCGDPVERYKCSKLILKYHHNNTTTLSLEDTIGKCPMFSIVGLNNCDKCPLYDWE